jgi:hypothetical protein
MLKRRKVLLWIGLILSIPATGCAGISVIFYSWLNVANPEYWPAVKAGLWAGGAFFLTVCVLRQGINTKCNPGAQCNMIRHFTLPRTAARFLSGEPGIMFIKAMESYIERPQHYESVLRNVALIEHLTSLGRSRIGKSYGRKK